MGFRLMDPEAGVTVGQFPHLFPASIAVGYGLDGLSGARHATPFWAILGVLAVYFAGARLFNRLTAVAAAGLLALNVVTVWFARYPNAEVVMQTFLFAALLANARAHVDGDRFFAPVAGLLLGLLLFLRFDAVLGVAGIAAGLLLGVFAGQRPRVSLVVTFGALVAAALLYYRGPLRAYANQPIEFVSNLPRWQLALLGLTLVIALVAVLARRHAILAARRCRPARAAGDCADPLCACALRAVSSDSREAAWQRMMPSHSARMRTST